MELDDFKTEWAEYGRKLDRSISLQTQILRETRVGRISSKLKWAFRGILFEQLMSVPAIVLLGIFISNHSMEPRYLVPAVVLDLFALASVLSCAFQLETLSRLDFGHPVVEIQKKLQRARILRLATIKWGFLLSPVLWIPLTIVAFRGILGIDGYVLFRGRLLAIDLTAGVAISALLYLVSKQLTDRVHRSAMAQRVLDELAGRNLSEAARFLGELTEFERECPYPSTR